MLCSSGPRASVAWPGMSSGLCSAQGRLCALKRDHAGLTASFVGREWSNTQEPGTRMVVGASSLGGAMLLAGKEPNKARIVAELAASGWSMTLGRMVVDAVASHKVGGQFVPAEQCERSPTAGHPLLTSRRPQPASPFSLPSGRTWRWNLAFVLGP